MSKKTANQSLIDSVRKLDKINNVDFEFDGELSEIIANPIAWGEAQVERALSENLEKYLQSKELGEKFWNEIKRKS
mgnify:CR=1 FL=1